MKFYGHTHPDHPNDQSKWEPLFTPFGQDEATQCQRGDCKKCEAMEPYHGHINKVAWWAAKFASEMVPAGSAESKSAWEWGYLVGIWHDLGKFAPDWQRYLAKKVDPSLAEGPRKVDHATAGAAFAQALKPVGDLVSYLIAGHHSGLADAPQLFEERLKKTIPEWKPEAEMAGVPLNETLPLPPLTRPEAGSDAMAFMLRFFFSALVDADWLTTESFMSPAQTQQRQTFPDDILVRMKDALEKSYQESFGEAEMTPVNVARQEVQEACLSASGNETGFFSLTVPTGGGKTLASLLFALNHALKNGLRRVIYVIPYTSIIKQNADVFRKTFESLSKEIGRNIVIEHHSKFDPTHETTANRLASENWDAPLIVTTNAQFFESLFANRSRPCRKLHRIGRSVIIFDEVQALPNHLFAPILRGLTCIVKDFKSSAVLCTATQPALHKRDDFEIGIPSEDVTPIIKNEKALFQTLKRVECHDLSAVDDQTLITHVMEHAQQGCLIVLNTTKAAQAIHETLTRLTNALHLSARMCPAHVVSVLERAKSLRDAKQPVVLVSTQLIEAGVDISFPVVYRAECGIDSFAQAAGRCNRNGELKDNEGKPLPGHVYLFEPIDHPIPKGLTDLTDAANVTRTHIVPNFPEADLLSLESIGKYFEQAIWKAGRKTSNWDKNHIVSGDIPCFNPNSQSLRSYLYKTAAEKFSLIPSCTHPVVIPWGIEGNDLVNRLRELHQFKRTPNRSHYRQAQQFTVQVYDNEWIDLQNRVDLLCDGAFAVLIHPENDYHPESGLKRPNAQDDPKAFVL